MKTVPCNGSYTCWTKRLRYGWNGQIRVAKGCSKNKGRNYCDPVKTRNSNVSYIINELCKHQT